MHIEISKCHFNLSRLFPHAAVTEQHDHHVELLSGYLAAKCSNAFTSCSLVSAYSMLLAGSGQWPFTAVSVQTAESKSGESEPDVVQSQTKDPTDVKTLHKHCQSCVNHWTYLQVSYVAFTGAQASEDDGIMGVKVGDKFTGDRGDL